MKRASWWWNTNPVRVAPAAADVGGLRAAFTLLELLVVMGLVALLAGMLGLAFRAPGGTTALQAAQATVAGLCGSTRACAALKGSDARLLVADDPGAAEDRLRWLIVVYEDPSAPGCWRSAGAGIRLPRDVFVVPPSPPTLPDGEVWPASRRSSALSTTAANLTIDGAAAGCFYHVNFTPRGTTGGGTLVLTIGRRGSGAGPVLDQPDFVRGVLLRPSGAFTLLDGPDAFGP